MDPGFQLLTQYANGFMVSQVLFAACELGVFDALAESPEPLASGAVAARLGCHADHTATLLDACVALGLLTAEATSGTAVYRNTELSGMYLASRSPTSQRQMLLYLAGTTYRCWAHLADAVREGRNQYTRAFGVPAHDLFSAIYRSEAEQLRFMRGLQEVWRVSGRTVLTAFDLSPFPVLCDLGGGSGALARECVSTYRDSRVIIFELPEVVQMARTHFPLGPEEQISFREGDFFRDPLPAADLYILARVLHDWADETCQQLLTRIRQACTPGGGVLVVESVLEEDGRGPLPTLLLSLNMALQSQGRERTVAQYRRLLAAAGFRHVRCQRTGHVYDAILASS